MENNKGKFIVIDGTDGSGKTTQLNLLKAKLEEEGYAVAVADFPQYNTKSAGMVEEYLSGKYGQADEVDPYKASIFYAVDRFDASAQIRRWLTEGKVVLANRYTSASLGHQGGKITNPLERKIFFNWLYDLEYKIFEIPRPDLTIVLQVESEISSALAKKRAREDWKGKTKDIHEDNFDHLKKAEQTYLEITSSLPGFKLIKCTHNGKILSPEAIHFLVWLATSQIVIHQHRPRPDFQSIGSLISANVHIVKNRDLILENNSRQNTNNNFSQNTINGSRQNHSNNPTNERAGNAPQTPPVNLPFLEKTENFQQNHQSIAEKHATELPASKQKVIAEKIMLEAKLPQKAHAGDAGYDLFSADYYSIPAYGQALVSTGIKLAIPEGQVGLIWDKSGLANEGITTMGGVIDAGYRGEIKVVVKNLSEDFFNIIPGQKIAQIIFQQLNGGELEEGEIIDDTSRQTGGFGSSGKF